MLTVPCSLLEVQQMPMYHGKSEEIVPFNALHCYSVLWKGLELARHVPGGNTDIYAKRSF